jgi:hypothetical protein
MPPQHHQQQQQQQQPPRQAAASQQYGSSAPQRRPSLLRPQQRARAQHARRERQDLTAPDFMLEAKKPLDGKANRDARAANAARRGLHGFS